MRLPAIDCKPLIGLPFLTRNCAPVAKKVKLKSTWSRRDCVSVMVSAIRSTAFDGQKRDSRLRRPTPFSNLIGLVEFLIEHRNDRLFDQID